MHHYNQRALLQPFLSLLPGEHIAFNQNEETIDSLLPRLLVFSFANGLAGLCDIDMASTLAYLSRYKSMTRVFSQLEQIPGSYRKAVAVGLFKASIEAREATLARQLLALPNLDVKHVVCDVRSVRYSPLARASMLQDVEMVQVLLDAEEGRSNDAYYASNALHGLVRSIATGTTPPESVTCIARLLIGAGAMVDSHDLIWLVEYTHAIELLHELAEATARTKPSSLVGSVRVLSYLVRHLDELPAYQILKAVFPSCEGMKPPKLPHRIICHELLLAATEKGYFTIFSMFLGHAQSLSEILGAAYRHGRDELVHLISLDEVRTELADSSARIQRDNLRRARLARSGIMQQDAYLSPMAEAIRSGRKAFIQQCEENGLQDGPADGGLFLAAASAPDEFNFMHALARDVPSFYLLKAATRMVELNKEDLALYWFDHWLERGSLADCHHGDGIMVQALEAGHIRLAHLVLDTIGIEDPIRNLPDVIVGSDDPSIILKTLKTHPLSLAAGNLTPRDIATCDKTRIDALLSGNQIPANVLESCLCVAMQRADKELAKKVLHLGADPSGPYAIRAAALQGPEMLHWILEKLPTSPSRLLSRQTQYQVLCGALKDAKNLPASLQTLLESGIFDVRTCRPAYYPDVYGNLPPLSPPLLAFALEASQLNPDGSAASVVLLLDAGADPDEIIEENISGNKTPLLMAIEVGNFKAVEALLTKGAHVNYPATYGVRRTPLQMAAEQGHLDMVTLLLDHGAEVDAEPALYAGATALQLSAVSGNCNIAIELLERGADLYQQPAKYQGRWPLEAAAEHGRMDMIALLWKASGLGFSDDICDRAIELAIQNGQEACADFVGELRQASSGGVDCADGGGSSFDMDALLDFPTEQDVGNWA